MMPDTDKQPNALEHCSYVLS